MFLASNGQQRQSEGVHPSLADPRTQLEPKAATQPGVSTARTTHPIGEASEYVHGGAAAPEMGTYNRVNIGVSHVHFMHIYFAKEHLLPLRQLLRVCGAWSRRTSPVGETLDEPSCIDETKLH